MTAAEHASADIAFALMLGDGDGLSVDTARELVRTGRVRSWILRLGIPNGYLPGVYYAALEAAVRSLAAR